MPLVLIEEFRRSDGRVYERELVSSVTGIRVREEIWSHGHEYRRTREIFHSDGIEVQSFRYDGQIWNQMFYRNSDGALEGEYKVWHENGRLMAQIFYRESTREGEDKQWNENGTPEYIYWMGCCPTQFNGTKKLAFLRLRRLICFQYWSSAINSFLISDLAGSL